MTHNIVYTDTCYAVIDAIRKANELKLNPAIINVAGADKSRMWFDYNTSSVPLKSKYHIRNVDEVAGLIQKILNPLDTGFVFGDRVIIIYA